LRFEWQVLTPKAAERPIGCFGAKCCLAPPGDVARRFSHFALESILRHMMRWLVTLSGGEAVLAQLVEWTDGEDWQIIRHEKRGVVLCGRRFEPEGSYEAVGQIADELLAHINRSARHQLSHFQGVSRSNIVEQRQDRDHVIVRVGLAVEMNTAMSVSWVKRAPDGTVIDTSEDRGRREQASSYHLLVRLQEAHPDLADALRYLDEEPSMYGFYKTGEAILRAIGRPKNWDALVKLGWTSDDELWRFTKSTHTKRHHRSHGPQKPMTTHEAELYIRSLLDKLIAHLNSTTS